MIYIFFVFFCIFLTFDGIYIYYILDKKILLSTSGSKIDFLSSDQKKIKKIPWLINYKKVAIRFSIYIFMFFVLYISNKLFFLKTLNSNFIPISILGKTIDIISFFENKWNSVIFIYNVSFSFFLIITLKYLDKTIVKKYLYIISKHICPKYNQKVKENILNNLSKKIKLGKDLNGKEIYITEEALYQNLCITGSIGSGKTSGAILNICRQLIRNGRGGVILDIKGNLAEKIKQICIQEHRENDLKIIALNSNVYFNLISDDTTSLEIASILKHVITLLSPTNNTDTYWLDKVENVLQNLFLIIEYYNKRKDIMELHKLVTDNEYLLEKINNCKENLLEGNDTEKTMFEIQNSILFVKNEYLKLDNKVLSIIKSEITRLTIPLVTEYEIYERFVKFSTDRKYISFQNTEEIIILSIDIGKNKALAKIIATFLKLNFQREVLKRMQNPKAIFFIADEYQEFANVEDARFLSLSREAKCINILSTQSYLSIKNVLKDETATMVLVQSLVNKIWFRNDDTFTISEVIKQLGKINIKKETESLSENATESKKYLIRQGFQNKKSSLSKAVGFVISKENEYDENFFSRELKTFEALVFMVDENKKIETNQILFERWDLCE